MRPTKRRETQYSSQHAAVGKPRARSALGFRYCRKRNMSYCRFENTFPDLEDCLEALREGEKLSKTEKEYAKKMIRLMFEFVEDVQNNLELDSYLLERD